MAGDSVRARSSALDVTAAGGRGPLMNAGADFVGRRAVVSVPATCANLGPGFDCLALALRLRNSFDVTRELDRANEQRGGARVEARGRPEDVRQLSPGSDNLFVRAFRALCDHVGARMPPLTVRIDVQLPPSRGLGSSATAVVGGILAANALLGEPLQREDLLNMAVSCEPGHHADNVAAALFGGLVVAGAHDSEGRLLSLSLPVPPELRAVLFVPDMPMSTTRSRSLLPASYSRGDATFNLSRVALLLAALQIGRLDLLATAMDDRFHQPYREQLFPALRPLIAAAREAGAFGAGLSGGGSSVLALATQRAEEARAAMEATARTLNVAGRGFVVEIAPEGAECRVEADDTFGMPDMQGASDD